MELVTKFLEFPNDEMANDPTLLHWSPRVSFIILATIRKAGSHRRCSLLRTGVWVALFVSGGVCCVAGGLTSRRWSVLFLELRFAFLFYFNTQTGSREKRDREDRRRERERERERVVDKKKKKDGPR